MDTHERQPGIWWSKRLFPAAVAVFAVAAGCLIAAMDTRPGWDDTGVTAGVLFLASAVASVLGVPWWLAPILVAGPLVIAEFGDLGWGAVLIAGISLAGAGIGAAVRAARRSPAA